jgi:Zn-dependent protease with chaperone function
MNISLMGADSIAAHRRAVERRGHGSILATLFVVIPRRACVVLSLLLAVCAPAASPAAEAPAAPNADLFEKSLRAASEAVRVYGTWDEPEQLRRVASIGYRLAQESGYRDFPLSFYLIDLPEPNAFALPGGQVFVTRGLLSLGLTDDELAALLGHEIAHVVHKHGIRMERRATLLNLLTQAAMLGVLLTADDSPRDTRAGQLPYPYNLENRGSNADLISGTYAAGMILSELLLRSYSREYEDEADESGQRWAAAAGFDPDGTQKLMEVLGSRLPSSKEYGYWRTHPFFEQRVTAAKARGSGLRQGDEEPTDEFRSWSQQRLLDLGGSAEKASPSARLVEAAALTAWPKGPEAERLRLEQVHRERERTLSRLPISRDYGALLSRYDRELAELARIDPRSELAEALRVEREELAREMAGLEPQAREIWKRGVYETGFLECFLSNWPHAPEAPEVALTLGEAYSRTGRQADAVAMYLRAVGSGAGEPAERARRGLRNLAPSLDQLTALAELSEQVTDPELADRAAQRLEKVAASYGDLASGAEYLQRFPAGPHVEVVSARQNALADNLYGEVVLYQGVGDHVKAIERIQKILTFAPTSPAAQKLLERVVLPG